MAKLIDVFTSKCMGQCTKRNRDETFVTVPCEMPVVLPRKSSVGEYKAKKRVSPKPLGVYEYEGYEWAGGKAPEFVCSCCRSKLPLSEPTHSEEDLDTLKPKLKSLWEIAIIGPYPDSEQPLDTFYTLQQRSISEDDVRRFAHGVLSSKEISLSDIVPKPIEYDFD